MRVVLCDDHLLFTEALADQLQARGHEVVATVPSIDRLGPVVMLARPQAVLLDLSFPHGSGLVAARGMRVVGYSGRIVLCTGETTARITATRQPVRESLRDGTLDAVVEKTADYAAIEAALLGRAGPSRSPVPSAFSTLTAREVEVLALLADGLTTAQVAASMRVATSTVHAHVKSAMLRLGARSRFGAVHHYITALGGAAHRDHARGTPRA